MTEPRIIACCGVECQTCVKYKAEECRGCPEEAGKPFWIEYVDKDVCPIYECCVKDKKFANCGKCSNFPCSKSYECKDPSISDDEFEKILIQQAKIFKEYNEQ
jgi:hypothetical protein